MRPVIGASTTPSQGLSILQRIDRIEDKIKIQYDLQEQSGYKSTHTKIQTMGEILARKVLVEIELPEGKSIEEVLRGVRYRIAGKHSLEELIRHASQVKTKEEPGEEPSTLLEKERR